MTGTVRSRAERTWAVARMGAAMHYAVPRILHQAGQLDTFYTDFYAGDLGRCIFSCLPAKLRPALVTKLAGRSSDDLPRGKVRSYPLFGIAYYLAQLRAKDVEAKSAVYRRAGEKFCRLVAPDIRRHSSALYTFTTAGLELLEIVRAMGGFGVVEQTIAPRALEESLLADENRRYPGWEADRVCGPATEALIEREKREWDLADLIVCGSDFVREGVRLCKGPVEKCVVVPYGVDETFASKPREAHGERLRVLTVGEVGLRKGAPYVAEVAKQLANIAEFRWVGASALRQKGLDQLAAHVDVRGPVPRREIHTHFDWADVFFLPSLCEGSATVTYEALISGIPVVTTPNAGSVVQNGINGFVVPMRDTAAMVDCIRQLAASGELLRNMQRAAAERASAVSLDAYRARLLQALSSNSVVAKNAGAQ